MNKKHIIEYIILALLVLVPAFALVSTVNQLRIERIQLYLEFPDTYTEYSDVDKDLIERVRDILLKNSAERNYDENGLTCYGHFLEREQELYVLLEQLACMPVGGFKLPYTPIPRDCNPALQQDALALINSTISLDMRLFTHTAQRYHCNTPQQPVLDYGKQVLTCVCGSPP